MAIVVTHLEKGGRFVVLGASMSKWATARAHAFFGNISPVEREGFVRTVAVCGADGVIQFAEPAQLRVLEVDGQPLTAMLGGQ